MPQPLSGLTVVVTRAKDQASALTDRLTSLGASVVEVATIAIAAPADGGRALREALGRVDRYAQVVVASPNGARALIAASAEVAASRLPPVACVGPSTAAVFHASAWSVNVVPDRAIAEGLVDAMPAPVADRARLLLVQAEVARPTLEAGLRALGWAVDRAVAYRTVDAEIGERPRRAAAGADVVTFTSSSTVERYVRLVGTDAVPAAVATIGPITSGTARDLGLTVTVEADPHTIDGLVAALVDWAGRVRVGRDPEDRPRPVP